MGLFDDELKQIKDNQKGSLFKSDIKETKPGGLFKADLKQISASKVAAAQPQTPAAQPVPEQMQQEQPAQAPDLSEFGYKPTGNLLVDLRNLFSAVIDGSKSGKLLRTNRLASEQVDKITKGIPDTIIPESPVMSAVASTPAIAARSALTLSRDFLPKNMLEMGFVLAAPEAISYLDELMSVGQAAIFETAPTATSQMLRAMMEIQDPVVKNGVMRKAAPFLFGHKVSEGLLKIPTEKLGVYDIDPVVGGIIKQAGKKGPELFARGLRTFTSEDIKLLGGRKLTKSVEDFMAKNSNDPEALAALVQNFTPPQQRMIMRRGVGDIKLVDKPITGKSTLEHGRFDPNSFDQLEKFSASGVGDVTLGKNDVVLYHGTSTELGQKILKEGLVPQAADYEKTGIARTFLTDSPDHPASPAVSSDDSIVFKIKTSKRNLKLTAKDDVPSYLAYRRIPPNEIISVLDRKTGVETFAPAHTPSEVATFGGEKFVDDAISKLNNPIKLSQDQIDMANSMAIRENLLQEADQIAQHGINATKPVPEGQTTSIEEALNARAPRSAPLQKAMAYGKEALDKLENFFEFEPRAKKFPQFRFELEQMHNYPRKASAESTSLIGSVLEILDNKKEYETFRKFIILQDWKESLENGEKIVGKFTAEQVNDALAGLSKDVTPAVMESIQRHYEVVNALGKDLVRRGYLSEEVLRDKYFPHKVLKYMDESGTGVLPDPTKPEYIHTPFRAYTQERVDSPHLIDTDYIKVMHRLLMKMKIDNTVDDFVKMQAEKFDALPKLPEKVRQDLFGEHGIPRLGRVYSIEGQNYKAYAYKPKGLVIDAQTAPEKIMADALEQNMSAEELDQRLDPANKLAMLQQTRLLPEEVYDSLVRFTQPQRYSHLFDLIRHPVRLWKRLTLTTAGIPWQMANFEGGLEQLFREGDYDALFKVPQAIGKMIKADDLDPIFRSAVEHELVFPQTPIRPMDEPILRDLVDDFGQLKELGTAPLRWFDFVSDISQNAPKLAKYMADTARIQKGLPVQTKTFTKELAGLTEQQKVIRNAKLTVVDMAVNSPGFNTMFRDFLFPFASWFYHNSKAWAKYSIRNPEDMIVRFGGMYAGMQYWNWSRYPDVEKKLPEYQRLMPHVVTGWKDEEGNHVVVNYQSTAQAASKWVAGDEMLYRISQVANGQISMEDALMDQAKATTAAPFHQSRKLLNPLLSAMWNIGTNQKKAEEGGGPVVPERLKGTTQGLTLQYQYMLHNLVTPISKFVRTEGLQEATPANPVLRFLRFGPLDLERAVGISKADLMKAERSIRFARGKEAEILDNQNYADIEDAYVESQLTNDYAKFNEVLERNTKKITLPTGRSVASYLKSPRVQLRILQIRLTKATTEDERRQLIAEIKDMREAQSLISVKRAPREQRGYIMEGDEQ